MEQTDNILWLLKQAWYFALTTVNDSVSEHGVSTRRSACCVSSPPSRACPVPISPAGC